jgi:hypothetical protein
LKSAKNKNVFNPQIFSRFSSVCGWFSAVFFFENFGVLETAKIRCVVLVSVIESSFKKVLMISYTAMF